MTEKLELKHIAPYLPYNVGISSEKVQHWLNPKLIGVHNKIAYIIEQTVGGNTFRETATIETCKLILRPLSDLTKEIEHNGEGFVPMYREEIKGFDESLGYFAGSGWIRFNTAESIRGKLLEWHFDVFGLIEKGLAIDINTLKP